METNVEPPSDDGRRLDVRDVSREISWTFVAFATVAGAPSILSILQDVFLKRELLGALQWIVDGYQDLTQLLGAAIEPLIAPILSRIGEVLSLNLRLDVQWRPMFVLLSLYAVAEARGEWIACQYKITRPGKWPPRLIAARRRRIGLRLAAQLALVLLASIAAGVSISAGWVAQAAAATLAIAIVSLPKLLSALEHNHWEHTNNTGRATSYTSHMWGALFWVVLVFAFAAMLGQVPPLQNDAGVATILAAILFLGLRNLGLGVRSKGTAWHLTGLRNVIAGLSLLGGFLCAAAILLADTLLRIQLN